MFGKKFSHIFIFSFLATLYSANALTYDQLITSLENAPVLRCSSPSCSSSTIKIVFNYFLFACKDAGCDDEKVLRVTPLGSTSHIQQYCVLSEPFHSSTWSVRIQADLIPSGAKIVLVAVPRASSLEQEYFKRPYILSSVIPRTQLYLVNRFVKNFCGDTSY